MNLKKAIELLEIEDRRSYPKRRLKAHLAIKLGTAAITRILYQRLKPTVPHKTLLPGETEGNKNDRNKNRGSMS